MAKYLDSTGLNQLWGVCKSTFLTTGGGDSRYLRHYNHSEAINANAVDPGWHDVANGITNAAHTNHSSLIYVSNVGTPFQLQIPDSTVDYIYKRSYSGAWSSWRKMKAGDSDTLEGHAASYFATSGHSHDSSYLKLSGGSLTGALSLVSAGSTPLLFNNSGAGIIGVSYGANCLKIKNTDGDGNVIASSGIDLYLGSNEYKVLHSGNYTSYCATAGHTHSYLPLSGGTITDSLIIGGSDIPEVSGNLASYASLHSIKFYRNGFLIPYQMDNTNDGGFFRVRGTTEDNVVCEIGTWDDYGIGETIQFNYYPTTSTITPTYSVSVPKATGTLALTSQIPTNNNQLTNGAGYITSSGSCNYANSSGSANTVNGYDETSFFRYRGTIDTNYVDLTTYSSGATNYQNPKNGIWNVERPGYSAGLITFTGYGSASGLDIYFHYAKGYDFKFRRRIDSNRLSGDWESFITSENISSQSVNYASSAGSVAWGNISDKPSTFTPSDHTHSYLPLAGGTVSGNVTANRLYISEAGGAVISGRNGISGTGDDNDLWIYKSDVGRFVFMNSEYHHFYQYVRIGSDYTKQQPSYNLQVDGTLNATTIYQNGVALGSRAFDSTSYLPLSGGTMTGTPYINMPASAASISDSQPFGITYGKIQCYGPLILASDTDGSQTEYTIITSGYGIGSATNANGLAIGYNSLTWKNNTIWHAGNDGSGSGLDADLIDGYDSGNLFVQNRGEAPTSFVDMTNYWDYSDPNYINLNSGTYSVSRTGYSELLVVFRGTGSTSALQLYTSYNDTATLYYRKTVDSSGLPGGWRYFITSCNIGSQSVNYASSAGYADSAGSVPNLSSSEIDSIIV